MVYCINVIAIIAWEIIRTVKKPSGGWLDDFSTWTELAECLINYPRCVYHYSIRRRSEMTIKENTSGIGECYLLKFTWSGYWYVLEHIHLHHIIKCCPIPWLNSVFNWSFMYNRNIVFPASGWERIPLLGLTFEKKNKRHLYRYFENNRSIQSNAEQ